VAVEVIHRRGAEDAEFPQRGLTEKIIGAAIEVHRWLGPGLLESVYQRALQHELALRAIPFVAQLPVPVLYKDVAIEPALRLDLVVAGRVVVEVKSVDVLAEIHRMQLLTYLRLTEIEAGLLLNFNVTSLRQGIKRVANTLRPSAPSAPLR